MSDETPEIETAEPESTGTDATVAETPAVESEAASAPRARRSTGGQTLADRYLTPMLLPLVAVGVILFFVLNISRVFIAGEGTLAILMAAGITLAVLIGGAVMSAAPQSRSNMLTIVVAVSFFMVMFSGFVAVGRSQGEHEPEVVECEKPVSEVKVTVPNGAIAFDAKNYQAKAGCVSIELVNATVHNLTFDPPGPVSPVLTADEPQFAWEFKAGTYTMYCTVTGHRATMEATLTVE